MNLDMLLNKNHYNGIFTGDFKSHFEKEVTKLLALGDEAGDPPPTEFRNEAIDALVDAYVVQTERIPDGSQVQRLGNWVLLEDLSDNHPDKVTRQAYPFLTKRQLRTRYFRERVDEFIQENHTRNNYLGGKKQSNYLKSE